MGLERMRRSIQYNLCEKSTDEDVTFNIEPDWDGNPDTTLICARYKGRRITAMSPLISDRYFCLSYVPPRPHDMTQTSAERSRLEMAVEMTISDLMREDSKLLSSGDVEVPILFQALNRPCLRYCAASSYKDSPVVCFVATDSVRDTLQSALAWQSRPVRRGSRLKQSFAIIGGMLEDSDLVLELGTDLAMYAIRSKGCEGAMVGKK
jgi:hypothetical protein